MIITVFIANASMTIDLSNKMNFYSPPSVHTYIVIYVPILHTKYPSWNSVSFAQRAMRASWFTVFRV